MSLTAPVVNVPLIENDDGLDKRHGRLLLPVNRGDDREATTDMVQWQGYRVFNLCGQGSIPCVGVHHFFFGGRCVHVAVMVCKDRRLILAQCSAVVQVSR